MTELRAYQLQLLDLLLAFQKICSERGIRWWLDSGSLLGAVRGKGFIPWDDDVDVCVLGEDYPKIKKALEDCPEPYHFQCSLREEETRLFPRFVDKSKTFKRIDPHSGKEILVHPWVDVFVLRETSLKFKKFLDPFYGRCLRRFNGSIKDGAAKQIAGCLGLPAAVGMKGIGLLLGKIARKGELCHDFGVPYYSLRKKEDILPLTEIEFEGHIFPAPADPDHYLRLIYGDYTIEKRTDSQHNILL